MNAYALQNRLKLLGESRGSIMDEIPTPVEKTAPAVGQVACRLCHPILDDHLLLSVHPASNTGQDQGEWIHGLIIREMVHQGDVVPPKSWLLDGMQATKPQSLGDRSIFRTLRHSISKPNILPLDERFSSTAADYHGKRICVILP